MSTPQLIWIGFLAFALAAYWGYPKLVDHSVCRYIDRTPDLVDADGDGDVWILTTPMGRSIITMTPDRRNGPLEQRSWLVVSDWNDAMGRRELTQRYSGLQAVVAHTRYRAKMAKTLLDARARLRTDD